MEDAMIEINGFNKYYITKEGKVISHKRKTVKVLQPKIDKDGYEVVCLHQNGKNYHRTIHRLVAEHFCENPENHPVVNHLDGNKRNNNYNNLCWCTVSENTKHAYDSGLFTVGRDAKGRWSKAI